MLRLSSLVCLRVHHFETPIREFNNVSHTPKAKRIQHRDSGSVFSAFPSQSRDGHAAVSIQISDRKAGSDATGCL
jgi:hypothetical protein